MGSPTYKEHLRADGTILRMWLVNFKLVIICHGEIIMSFCFFVLYVYFRRHPFWLPNLSMLVDVNNSGTSPGTSSPGILV